MAPRVFHVLTVCVFLAVVLVGCSSSNSPLSSQTITLGISEGTVKTPVLLIRQDRNADGQVVRMRYTDAGTGDVLAEVIIDRGGTGEVTGYRVDAAQDGVVDLEAFYRREQTSDGTVTTVENSFDDDPEVDVFMAFCRDRLGRLLRVEMDTDGHAEPELTVLYTYGENGLMEKNLDEGSDGISDSRMAYARDPEGRIVETYFDDDADGVAEAVLHTAYDADGLPVSQMTHFPDKQDDGHRVEFLWETGAILQGGLESFFDCENVGIPAGLLEVLEIRAEARASVQAVIELEVSSYITEEGVVVVSPVGRWQIMDSEVWTEVQRRLNEGRRLFVLDMARVEEMNGNGFKELVDIYKRVFGAGGRLSLAELSRLLSERFALIGFNKIFPIYSYVTEAIASF